MTAVLHVRNCVAHVLSQLGLTDARVLVACSGGPDSSVLVDVLDRLRTELALTIVVGSVDHGIRSEAKGEVEAVMADASRRGVTGVSRRVTLAQKTPSAARDARYRALAEMCQETGASAVVVAHTADDQAETLLDRLVRGAGTRGLAAMAPRRLLVPGVALVRPMLGVTRAEVEAYVAEAALRVFHDPSNESRERRRGRIRKDVLPLLARERPDIARSLARTAERLRADSELLDALADEAFARLARASGDDTCFDARQLAVLPRALFPRVVTRAAPTLLLEETHLQAIKQLCESTHGTRSLDLSAEIVAERRYDTLVIGRRPAQASWAPVRVEGPGTYTFAGRQIEIRALEITAAGSYWFRGVLPGDRFRGKKLQDRLVDAKVPAPERPSIPLLVHKQVGGEELVLWMPRLPVEDRLVVEAAELL